jgi:hypothetical protein
MAEQLRLVPPLRPTSGMAQFDGASTDEVSADCSELLNGVIESPGSIVGSRVHAKDVLQEAYIQVDALPSYQFPTWARLSLNVFNLLDSAYFEASTFRSDVQQAVNPPLLSILIVTCRLKRPRHHALTQAVCNLARRHVYSR